MKRQIGLRKRALVSNINVTPFVDVMLVLLVVFMIASPEIMPSLLIDLPKIEKSDLVNDNHPIILTISRDSSVYLNDKPINQENLLDELVAITNSNRESRIFIRGDEKSDYGSVAQVIGLISNNGFKKVALVTKDQDS